MSENTKSLQPIIAGEYGYYGYDQLIASFGVEVLTQLDEESYQGDTLALLKDGDRFGLLTFGWGSCSGCDALQAIYDSDTDEGRARVLSQVTELRDELWHGVTWHDTAAEMAAFLRDRDWDGLYINEDLVRDFLAVALPILDGAQ